MLIMVNTNLSGSPDCADGDASTGSSCFAKSHRPVRSSFALDSCPFGPAESNVSCSLTREEDVVEGVVEGDDVVASKKSLLTLSQYVHCVVSAVI